jgi:hypothetical protein
MQPICQRSGAQAAAHYRLPIGYIFIMFYNYLQRIRDPLAALVAPRGSRCRLNLQGAIRAAGAPLRGITAPRPARSAPVVQSRPQSADADSR